MVMNVYIPASVERIEQGAFANCTRLSKVMLHSMSKLQVIGPKAFACTMLSSIILPPGVKYAIDSFERGVDVTYAPTYVGMR